LEKESEFESDNSHKLAFFFQEKIGFFSVKNVRFKPLNELLSARDVLFLDEIVIKFRSFSNLESELKDKNFRIRIWNQSCRTKNLGIGVEIGAVEKKSRSPSWVS
jgi:hypothetical protein